MKTCMLRYLDFEHSRNKIGRDKFTGATRYAITTKTGSGNRHLSRSQATLYAMFRYTRFKYMKCLIIINRIQYLGEIKLNLIFFFMIFFMYYTKYNLIIQSLIIQIV